MVHIDSIRCTGCGYCIDVCPQKAITIENNVAVIHQELCVQCGTCIEACPVGAIRELAPAYAKTVKGGERMTYGYGRGYGGRGGMGFGFRGSSPPWPYVGRGRGGLPRCGYFFSGAAAPYPSYGAPTTAPGTAPFAPQMTREQELDFLKNQAEAIKGQLEQIEVRMRDLESEK